jgi:putative transposase
MSGVPPGTLCRLKDRRKTLSRAECGRLGHRRPEGRKNPKGIPSSSPGLSRHRGTTLGYVVEDLTTPTGLCRSFDRRPLELQATRRKSLLVPPPWEQLDCTEFMPQSLSAVYIHLVFSTKARRAYLRDKETRETLHRYLGGVSKELECPPLRVGGVEDHVHLVSRFGRTITQGEWVKELKRVSNLWLKSRNDDYDTFEWQRGYGAFSVSKSDLDRVIAYIANQEEHHRHVTFQDEFRALLREHGVEWDERYVWD